MNSTHILLVEDNEGDVLLTLDCFEELDIETVFTVARNGEEALNALSLNEDKEIKNKPDLILLDINLPVYNGLEILKKIKSNDKTKKIPVVMLTSSDSQSDIDTAYENFANSYVVKPYDSDGYTQTAKNIESYWLQFSKITK